ncbi:MAG: ABC transporter permease [Acetatifactor sp.]|nr:ABC transporter permease [Acetatifactor sp.]
MKRLVLLISGGISFLIFLILFLVARSVGHSQDSQLMAERWSVKKDVAQISCFFSVNAPLSEDAIEEFEHSIDGAIQEVMLTQQTTVPNREPSVSARLWVDAYSASGRIMLSSERATLEADAYGIGGDFFLFHPLRLVTGAYFSGNDLMQDYCVIDEDAAWQLFGSSDVVGQMVTIRGIPHMVTGVIERPEGRLEEAAGLSGTVVYVSYKTLSELGTNNGISHYEIVMPNPISNFALNFVKDGLGASEKDMEILENNSRYSFVSSLQNIRAFGTRSMNGKAIIYPYWENVARGCEDIVALLTFLYLIFLLYPVILALVWFIRWWRHKGWTLKDVYHIGKDKWERYLERRRAEKASGQKGAKRRFQLPIGKREEDLDWDEEDL